MKIIFKSEEEKRDFIDSMLECDACISISNSNYDIRECGTKMCKDCWEEVMEQISEVEE